MKEKKMEIRACQPEQLRALWEIAYDGDLEWMKWNGPYFNDPIYSWQEFSEKAIQTVVNQPLRRLVLLDGQIIGQISAYWEDGDLRRWLEFGLCLYSKETWGKQLGTRACQIWISYLFGLFPDIEHVGFTTWSGNLGMMKVGEKLGMKQEARIRKVRFYQGSYFDSIKYGVLREEWYRRTLDNGY